MHMFSRPSSAQVAESYKNLPVLAPVEDDKKKAAFAGENPEFRPSPWTEISGVRDKVSGKITDVMAVQPAVKLPPLFLDQSVIDTFHDYNFHDLTTTREDVQKWNEPITEEWLARYNKEMKFKEKDKVTLKEVQSNPQLRKVIAQFALHDKADEVKQAYGPRPVAYNDIPFKRPLQPTYLSNSQIHMPWSAAERLVAKPAGNPTIGSKIKSGFKWLGKKLGLIS